MSKTVKQETSVEDDKERKCFLICPLNDENIENTNNVRKCILEPVLKEKGYNMHSSGDSGKPGVITNQIIDELKNADLVIADLTGGNPNVFYELAIRHCFKKPVITIMCAGEKIPFDLHPTRTIFYNGFQYDKVIETQEELKKQLKAVSENEVDNVVYTSLSALNIVSNIPASDKDSLNVVSYLNNRMDRLEGLIRDMAYNFSSFNDRKTISLDELNDLCHMDLKRKFQLEHGMENNMYRSNKDIAKNVIDLDTSKNCSNEIQAYRDIENEYNNKISMNKKRDY